jgi:hypothetical protein
MRWVAILVCLFLVGCSSGKKCQSNADCPEGQYCGPDKRCLRPCKTSQDCPAGTTCAPVSGRCVPDTDGGPPTDYRAPFDLAADIPILQPLDIRPSRDVRPWQPDVKPWWPKPDVKPWWPLPDLWPWYPDTSSPCLNVGAPCTQGGGQCGTGQCLITDSGGIKGVCTCPCVPDDPTTPLVVEDTCPNLTQNRCGDVGGAGYCFKLCKPKLYANDCQGGLSCHPSSGAAVGLYDDAVCLYYGCTSGADCPVVLDKACTTTTPSSCAAGEECLALVSGQTAGRCAKAGSCDATSGLCAPHVYGNATAKVGDTCKDDTQCGGNMRCLMEIDDAKYRKKGGLSCQEDSECCSGLCQGGLCTSGLCLVHNRNGYCTISGCKFASLTASACPAGSTCNGLYTSGLCQKTCTLAGATDCRGNPGDLYGDYECRAWNNLSLAGGPVSTGPVCDFGPSLECDTFASTPLDCSSVGDTTNPTSMSCRGLDGQVKTNKYDPLGLCLDTTSSGAAKRNPLPTP